MSLVVGGLLLNVLLALVARSLSSSDFALFSGFWSAALLAGFGVFLPVEQWLASRVASGRPVVTATADLAPVLLGVLLVELAVVGVVGHLLFGGHGGGDWLLAALLAACVVSAVQFTVRGVLIATGRLTAFALVLVVDVVVRLGVAAALSLTGTGTAASFAWAVVAGLFVAHLPVAVLLWRQARTAGGAGGASPAGSVGPRPLRAVLVLMVGSFGAQLLLNGPAVAVASAAPVSQLADVGVYQAAFQLVRVPLFLVVPVQATLIPVMSRALERRSADAVRRVATSVLAALVVTVGAATLLGWSVGPSLVRAVYGADYSPSREMVGVLAAGSAAYLALLVLTQLQVAADRYGSVGAAWGSGALAAASVYLVGRAGGLHETEVASWSFATGCLAGVIVVLVLLVTRGLGGVPGRAAAPDQDVSPASS